MQKEPTHPNIAATRLAKLLEIALYAPEADELSAEEVKREMLEHRLAESFPQALRHWKQVEALLAEAADEAGCRGRPTLANSLTNPATPLEHIEKFKSAAKREAALLPEGPAKRVSLVLYYAAIAAGLTLQAVRITSLPVESLCQRFEQFAGLSWVTPQLRSTFEKAAKLCRSRTFSD
jgi:hypothetical protein